MKKLLAVLILMSFTLSGCATLLGAGIGALAGGGRGALIGAGIGALGDVAYGAGRYRGYNQGYGDAQYEQSQYRRLMNPAILPLGCFPRGARFPHGAVIGNKYIFPPNTSVRPGECFW